MKLDSLRNRIDKIDLKIVSLLKDRIVLAQKIAEIKKQAKLNLKDETREKEIYKKLEVTALKNNLDPKWLKRIFNLIISNSKKVQSQKL